METRTLGDLRAELADRLNMSSQALSDATKRVLNSFLREAHANLCQQYTWPALRRDWVLPCVVGQTMYTLPTDSCGYTPDPIRVQSVYVEYETSWLPLVQGIEPWRYTVTEQMRPLRYDIAHNNANPAVQPPGLTYS